MKKLSILLISFLLISCTNNEKAKVEVFSEGAKIVEQKRIYHGFQSEVVVNNFSQL